jgi:uncharacterized protein YgiB involved in biofilm formation
MRKSSVRVTLALIGVAALGGCGQEQRRDVYKSREDCLADWSNKPEDCKPATEATHASRGYWYGPIYPIPFGHSSRNWNSGARSIGSSASGTHSSVSRGGFGSSAHSSGG